MKMGFEEGIVMLSKKEDLVDRLKPEELNLYSALLRFDRIAHSNDIAYAETFILGYCSDDQRVGLPITYLPEEIIAEMTPVLDAGEPYRCYAKVNLFADNISRLFIQDFRKGIKITSDIKTKWIKRMYGKHTDS